MTNEALAARLAEVADLLELDPQANHFRVAAYRDAAELIRGLRTPVTAILKRDGREGLDRLPGIGAGLAGTIEELLRTEHLGLLERLRERYGSEELFGELPGIGPVLAERIHRELGVETLPELEQALHEGRLRQVAGVGPTLERHIREALQLRLRWARPAGPDAPPETELLDVDREYREMAAAGRLRKIAPRRFNPEGIAWLPVLHTRRGRRDYTALYSNSELAHALGKTQDWVVLYHSVPGQAEQQVTVVTETHGPRKGRRVVRGRPTQLRRGEHAPPEDAAPAHPVEEAPEDREPADAAASASGAGR